MNHEKTSVTNELKRKGIAICVNNDAAGSLTSLGYLIGC